MHYLNILDLDECEAESLNDCDVNANCTNMIGGYDCECHESYFGDGFMCISKIAHC